MNKMEKTPQCFSEQVLLDYLGKKLDTQNCEKVEEHISNCTFCLSQLSLAVEVKKAGANWTRERVPSRLVEKVKALVKNDKGKNHKEKMRKIKKNLFLAGAIIFFIISFLLPKYFMQCLVVTLILGMRWAFESERGRTLIMVLDSWRRHSHDEDDEISNRLKDKFKSPHL